MSAKFEVVKFQTKDKVTLNGLYAKPKKGDPVIIFIHGLTGSLFSGMAQSIADKLTRNGIGLLYFNNRGAEIVAKFKKEDQRKTKGYESLYLGTALEKFTDSRLDLEAAIDFLKEKKHKEIYLMGHSTGCQKSVYYLSQRGKQKDVTGVILIAPLSDYGVLRNESNYRLWLEYTQRAVKNGRSDQLMPQELIDGYWSNQRFLSLTDPNSEEEIFTYASDKEPGTLRKVKIPTLVILGEEDQYADRSVLKLVEWFEANVQAKQKRVTWIEGANHSFQGKEKKLVEEIIGFVETK